jgi:tripartite-type tricarboxylate transporter receptor subunit TctC
MALVGPKGLAPDIVKKWDETIRQVLKDPQVVQAIEKLDFVVDPESGEQFKKEIVDEYAVFKQIAADLNK